MEKRIVLWDSKVGLGFFDGQDLRLGMDFFEISDCLATLKSCNFINTQQFSKFRHSLES